MDLVDDHEDSFFLLGLLPSEQCFTLYLDMIWKDQNAAFFKMMGILWFFPSIGALVILVTASSDSPWGLERILAFLIFSLHIYLGYRWLCAPKNK